MSFRSFELFRTMYEMKVLNGQQEKDFSKDGNLIEMSLFL